MNNPENKKDNVTRMKKKINQRGTGQKAKYKC